VCSGSGASHQLRKLPLHALRLYPEPRRSLRRPSPCLPEWLCKESNLCFDSLHDTGVVASELPVLYRSAYLVGWLYQYKYRLFPSIPADRSGGFDQISFFYSYPYYTPVSNFRQAKCEKPYKSRVICKSLILQGIFTG